MKILELSFLPDNDQDSTRYFFFLARAYSRQSSEKPLLHLCPRILLLGNRQEHIRSIKREDTMYQAPLKHPCILKSVAIELFFPEKDNAGGFYRISIHFRGCCQNSQVETTKSKAYVQCSAATPTSKPALALLLVSVGTATAGLLGVYKQTVVAVR